MALHLQILDACKNYIATFKFAKNANIANYHVLRDLCKLQLIFSAGGFHVFRGFRLQNKVQVVSLLWGMGIYKHLTREGFILRKFVEMYTKTNRAYHPPRIIS